MLIIWDIECLYERTVVVISKASTIDCNVNNAMTSLLVDGDLGAFIGWDLKEG